MHIDREHTHRQTNRLHTHRGTYTYCRTLTQRDTHRRTHTSHTHTQPHTQTHTHTHIDTHTCLVLFVNCRCTISFPPSVGTKLKLLSQSFQFLVCMYGLSVPLAPEPSAADCALHSSLLLTYRLLPLNCTLVSLLITLPPELPGAHLTHNLICCH